MVFLTKLKPEPMGVHSLSVAYGVNSLVMSGDGAAAYISVKDVPAGTPLTNTDYWQPHTDLSAVRQSAEAAAQKASAARDEMLEIARSLTDAVEKSGNPVWAELVGGLPFDRVATVLSPKQAGSGDPSPTNIRPISGWTGAELARCGKNLVKLVFTSNNITVTENTDGSVTATNTTNYATNGAYCLLTGILPAGTYTVERYDAMNEAFLQTSGASDYSNRINAGTAYTFEYDGESYLRIIYGNIPANSSVTYKIQLEAGDTATEFEPYQGDTYAADFGQTVYGGTIDWQTGVMTVDRGYKTLDGTENWSKDSYGFYTPLNGLNKAYDYMDAITCSHMSTAKSNRTLNDVSYAVSGFYDDKNTYPTKNWLYAKNTATPTVDDWKAYLAAQASAGTPVQIAYKLATPTTIQLTSQEIKQLQGVNTLYGDGSISIVGRVNPALALDARIAALEAAATAE